MEASAPLKILITNLKLTARSGTEMYVRDLGLELRRRGHTPMVYTPVASGAIVDELSKIRSRLESHILTGAANRSPAP